MDPSQSQAALFAVRDWPDGRAATLEVRSQYLNYDVADALKSELRDAVQARLDRGVRAFVLDLSKVSIVDSNGVGVMITLHRAVEAAGARLWLVGITHFLQKMFGMMRLDAFFRVEATEADVERALATPSA